MKARITLIVVSIILLLGTLGGIGTYAWFISQAASSVNVFTTGELIINNKFEEPTPVFSLDVDGLWYPGKTTSDTNKYVKIRNNGSLDARITGISAEIKGFNKNDAAKSKFADWMNVKVIAPIDMSTPPRVNKTVFEGTLSQLLNESPAKLFEIVVLKPGQDYSENLSERSFYFEATLSEEADNDIQGVTATIDFFIHATQDNDEAVEYLINNN